MGKVAHPPGGCQVLWWPHPRLSPSSPHGHPKEHKKPQTHPTALDPCSDPSQAPPEWQRRLLGHQRGVPGVLFPSFGISHEAASPEVWLIRDTPGPAAPRGAFAAGGSAGNGRVSVSPRARPCPIPSPRGQRAPGQLLAGATLPPAATTVASSLSSALPPLFRRARSGGCLPAPASLPVRRRCLLRARHSRLSQHHPSSPGLLPELHAGGPGLHECPQPLSQNPEPSLSLRSPKLHVGPVPDAAAGGFQGSLLHPQLPSSSAGKASNGANLPRGSPRGAAIPRFQSLLGIYR